MKVKVFLCALTEPKKCIFVCVHYCKMMEELLNYLSLVAPGLVRQEPHGMFLHTIAQNKFAFSSQNRNFALTLCRVVP